MGESDAPFAELLALKRLQRSSLRLSTKNSQPFAMRALRDRLSSRDNISSDVHASGNFENMTSWNECIATKRSSSELADFIVTHPLPARYRIQLWRTVVFTRPSRPSPELEQALSHARHEASMDQLTKAYKVITMDIHRTPWIVGDAEFNSLRCVLTAFAMRHPGIGYCQGMNLILAIPVIVGFSDDELLEFLEETVCLGRRGVLQCCSGFEDLTVFRMFVTETETLLVRNFPTLWHTLLNAAVDLTLVAFDPFLTLFASRLPLHAVLRVWDFCLFTHIGSTPSPLPGVSFAVVSCLIAVLKHCLVPMADQLSDGLLIAAFHRKLERLTDSELDIIIATAFDMKDVVFEGLQVIRKEKASYESDSDTDIESAFTDISEYTVTSTEPRHD